MSCSGHELMLMHCVPQAVYQSLLHLSWIDRLLDNIRVIFVNLYANQLKKPLTSVVECSFDGYFDQQLKELEGSAEIDTQRKLHSHSDDFALQSKLDDGIEEPPPPIPGLLSGW